MPMYAVLVLSIRLLFSFLSHALAVQLLRSPLVALVMVMFRFPGVFVGDPGHELEQLGAGLLGILAGCANVYTMSTFIIVSMDFRRIIWLWVVLLCFLPVEYIMYHDNTLVGMLMSWVALFMVISIHQIFEGSIAEHTVTILQMAMALCNYVFYVYASPLWMVASVTGQWLALSIVALPFRIKKKKKTKSEL